MIKLTITPRRLYETNIASNRVEIQISPGAPQEVIAEWAYVRDGCLVYRVQGDSENRLHYRPIDTLYSFVIGEEQQL